MHLVPIGSCPAVSLQLSPHSCLLTSVSPPPLFRRCHSTPLMFIRHSPPPLFLRETVSQPLPSTAVFLPLPLCHSLSSDTLHCCLSIVPFYVAAFSCPRATQSSPRNRVLSTASSKPLPPHSCVAASSPLLCIILFKLTLLHDRFFQSLPHRKY